MNEDLKKNMFRLIIISILILLTSCNNSKDTTALKDGTYVLEHTGEESALLPSVTIAGNEISFIYDFLSSYIPHGSYTIDNNILTMKTSDGDYYYVFKIEGDKLIFQESESSPVRLADDRLGIKITDNAVFKLKVN